MSVVSSSGLASRGMKAGAVAEGSGFVLDDMAAAAVSVISVVSDVCLVFVSSWRCIYEVAEAQCKWRVGNQRWSCIAHRALRGGGTLSRSVPDDVGALTIDDEALEQLLEASSKLQLQLQLSELRVPMPIKNPSGTM